ncbi:MAG: hypothetical protein GY786_18690, partial [Proteobacteria bacterium]|nr:hypothetical protein [Pseudomonadota bacterium]
MSQRIADIDKLYTALQDEATTLPEKILATWVLKHWLQKILPEINPHSPEIKQIIDFALLISTNQEGFIPKMGQELLNDILKSHTPHLVHIWLKCNDTYYRSLIKTGLKKCPEKLRYTFIHALIAQYPGIQDQKIRKQATDLLKLFPLESFSLLTEAFIQQNPPPGMDSLLLEILNYIIRTSSLLKRNSGFSQ